MGDREKTHRRLENAGETTEPVVKQFSDRPPSERLRLIKVGNAADVGGISKTKTAQQQPAALRQKQESAGEWTEPITGMKFRRIPGGSFRMGSPSSEEGRDGDETQHTVSVGEFWLGETEVTQAQWQAVMGSNPS